MRYLKRVITEDKDLVLSIDSTDKDLALSTIMNPDTIDWKEVLCEIDKVVSLGEDSNKYRVAKGQGIDYHGSIICWIDYKQYCVFIEDKPYENMLNLGEGFAREELAEYIVGKKDSETGLLMAPKDTDFGFTIPFLFGMASEFQVLPTSDFTKAPEEIYEQKENGKVNYFRKVSTNRGDYVLVYGLDSLQGLDTMINDLTESLPATLDLIFASGKDISMNSEFSWMKYEDYIGFMNRIRTVNPLFPVPIEIDESKVTSISTTDKNEFLGQFYALVNNRERVITLPSIDMRAVEAAFVPKPVPEAAPEAVPETESKASLEEETKGIMLKEEIVQLKKEIDEAQEKGNYQLAAELRQKLTKLMQEKGYIDYDELRNAVNAQMQNAIAKTDYRKVGELRQHLETLNFAESKSSLPIEEQIALFEERARVAEAQNNYISRNVFLNLVGRLKLAGKRNEKFPTAVAEPEAVPESKTSLKEETEEMTVKEEIVQLKKEIAEAQEKGNYQSAAELKQKLTILMQKKGYIDYDELRNAVNAQMKSASAEMDYQKVGESRQHLETLNFAESKSDLPIEEQIALFEERARASEVQNDYISKAIFLDLAWRLKSAVQTYEESPTVESVPGPESKVPLEEAKGTMSENDINYDAIRNDIGIEIQGAIAEMDYQRVGELRQHLAVLDYAQSQNALPYREKMALFEQKVTEAEMTGDYISRAAYLQLIQVLEESKSMMYF